MEWINYHHLLYFWTVAREGSIARACEKLRLAQPTISGQLRQLEESLGEKLFSKAGRGLALTDVGHTVYRYADEIFSLGREMQGVLKGRPRGRPVRLMVGISDAVPKLIAYLILQPALSGSEPVQLVCQEAGPQELIGTLSSHALDVVLTDAPLTSNIRVKAFSHLLGSCGVSLFAAPALATRLRKDFPRSLDGAPFLMPFETAALRRSLEQWLSHHRITPQIVGEFQDSALLKTFGQAGAGVFAVPSAIRREVRMHYRVAEIGSAEGIHERYYAITVERKIKHPAVVQISEAARDTLFAKTSD